MRRLIDISPPIVPDLAVWPGDTRYTRAVNLDRRRGDPVTLSSITATLHLGAHADGPNHYVADGPGIGERPLAYYFGPCRVVAVDKPRGERIVLGDLPANALDDLEGAPRLLFATGSFPDANTFNEDFNSLSPELIDAVAEAGGRLVGIDTPSVDPFDSKALESHAAVAQHDMAILEGLDLAGVAPGQYTLIALPLRLLGADASPVRAALLAER